MVLERSTIGRIWLDMSLKTTSKTKMELVDTEERVGEGEKKAVKEKMENYIRMIREFCDGLEVSSQISRPTVFDNIGEGWCWVHQVCRELPQS
jgi:hypothetical protein